MHKQALAKIFFVIAALLFVAKPFLGFSLFSRNHPPAVENIFIKAFAKRKVEITGDSMSAIQKKLAEPLQASPLLPFVLFLIFPFIYRSGINTTNRFLRRTRLSLLRKQNPYLLNKSFLI